MSLSGEGPDLFHPREYRTVNSLSLMFASAALSSSVAGFAMAMLGMPGPAFVLCISLVLCAAAMLLRDHRDDGL